MKKDFNSAVEGRRTHYALGKDVAIGDDIIQNAVEHAVKHTPSAFNSQSGRVVVLLDKEHDKMWEITRESLRKIVPSDQFAATDGKMDAFKGAYGTVLFFDDHSIVEGLQQQFALYKDNFPVWAQQSNGMLQFVIWTALENEGLGASLQHYNEVIEGEVKSEWKFPESWKLIAQMPFGNPLAEPSEKQFSPLHERVKIFK